MKSIESLDVYLSIDTSLFDTKTQSFCNKSHLILYVIALQFCIFKFIIEIKMYSIYKKVLIIKK
jgi:hypothetical protein